MSEWTEEFISEMAADASDQFDLMQAIRNCVSLQRELGDIIETHSEALTRLVNHAKASQ